MNKNFGKHLGEILEIMFYEDERKAEHIGRKLKEEGFVYNAHLQEFERTLSLRELRSRKFLSPYVIREYPGKIEKLLRIIRDDQEHELLEAFRKEIMIVEYKNVSRETMEGDSHDR